MHIAWSYAFSCPSDVSTGFDFCIFQIHMSYLKKIRKKRTVFNFFSILILDGTIITMARKTAANLNMHCVGLHI